MSDERFHPYRDDLPAYALGALDAEDSAALEAHLAECQECRSELAEYQSVASGLLESIPPQQPPPHVRSELIDRLPSRQAPTSKPSANIFERFSVWQAAMAIVLLFLLGLNIFSSLQIRELRQAQAALADHLADDQTAIAMLAYPSTMALPVEADIENVAGSMLVDEEKRIAVLVTWNLPEVEAGQTYQVWLIDAEGKRVSGGLFRPDKGQRYTTTTVWSPEPFGQYDAVGVTVEPEGGSDGPTGARILSVDL